MTRRRRSRSSSGAVPPQEYYPDQEFELTQDGLELARIKLDWPTPDDLDMEIYHREADGSLTQVATSGNLPGQKEGALLQNPATGTYVVRVMNYASVTPQ